MKYWKSLFDKNPIEEFCTTMLLNHKPDGTPSQDEKYYLLSDCVPQDCEIRKKLDTKYLEFVLERHQFEKNDEKFEKGCLYCRDVIQPTRAEYLSHLYGKHFLQLGKAENLVFIDELIDVVEQKMKNLICLYCEKTFKDRMTLKEHMRKKGHKRINPENKFYDKFFLTNYYKDRQNPVDNTTKAQTPKQQRKCLTAAEGMPHRERQDSSRVFNDLDDSDWSDWETNETLPIKCLFCDATNLRIDDIKIHMMTEHTFNFEETTKNLNFYKKIKLVNYIRYQMQHNQCINCDLKFSENSLLLDHMKSSQHFQITHERQFNQPEFFFPTIDDDPFLCCIEDDERHVDDDSAIVICEESTVKLNAAAENLVKETLLL